MNHDENKPLMRDVPPVWLNERRNPLNKEERGDMEEINDLFMKSCYAEAEELIHWTTEKIREKASSLMNKEGLTMEEALSRLHLVYRYGEEPEVVMK